jgi:hypothetical protein
MFTATIVAADSCRRAKDCFSLFLDFNACVSSVGHESGDRVLMTLSVPRAWSRQKVFGVPSHTATDKSDSNSLGDVCFDSASTRGTAVARKAASIIAASVADTIDS